MVLPGFGEIPIATNVALDTARVTAVDVRPPNVAWMFVEPVAIAVATPTADIVAVVVLDDTHDDDDVTFCVLPSEYCAVAVNCSVVPAGTDAFGGVTVTPVSVAEPTTRIALPVTVPVTGMDPPETTVAVMEYVPAPVALVEGCATPAAVIVTFGSDVDQFTSPVTGLVVLSENVPVAVNCTVEPPTLVFPGLGLTTIETKVAVVTVNSTVADGRPPNCAVMLLVPAATPVATPSGEIVAIVVVWFASDGDTSHEAEDVTSWLLPSE